MDAASFEYLGSAELEGPRGSPLIAYAKDAHVVYTGCGEPLPEADPATFTYLGFGYARDRSSVWFYGRVMPGVDVGTFRMLGWGYARDATHVFDSDGEMVRGADLETLRVGLFDCAGPYGRTKRYMAIDNTHGYTTRAPADAIDPTRCVVVAAE